MSAPAAWLADPTGRHQLRYWDGNSWTDHVSDSGVQGTDPVAGGGAPQAPSTSQRWMDKAKQLGQQAAASASAAVDSASDTWNSQTRARSTAAPVASPASAAAPAAGVEAAGASAVVAETASASASEEDGVADQLHKLAELRDRGVLTEEEFQAQKAKILKS